MLYNRQHQSDGAQMIRIILLIVSASLAANATASTNRIDIVRHDAPELAQFGQFAIGVRTLELTDRNRPDVVNTDRDGTTHYYDRKLTVELWYPATPGDGNDRGGIYRTLTRNPDITATLHGRAVRDAAPLANIGRSPLVIISHGYPGNRYLMSHLGENLASKGYVVAAIDHRDSTYDDFQPITSTLYNRPLDQLFVIEQVAEMAEDADSFLHELVDADRTGVVGYSMGAYGLLINMGGGYSDILAQHEIAPPNELATYHAASNPEFANRLTTRIKAGFAIAPWGMARGVWQPAALQNISTPTFYLAGSLDEVAGYEDGVRAIFDSTTQSERYLLTFNNAGHHAGAPIPVPIEILLSEGQEGADHYTDPVWDSVRMNNIMDHFVTAFFDLYLKGDDERLPYLRPGTIDEEDSGWNGFPDGTARGLSFEHRVPGQ